MLQDPVAIRQHLVRNPIIKRDQIVQDPIEVGQVPPRGFKIFCEVALKAR